MKRSDKVVLLRGEIERLVSTLKARRAGQVKTRRILRMALKLQRRVDEL